MFIWILAVLIAIWVLIYLLNQIYVRTNYYKNSLVTVQQFIEGVPNDLEIVNTGTVHGRYAFDYETSGMKGYNLAVIPQSLAYDEKILKQYSPNIMSGGIVIIVLPIFIFSFVDYENDQTNNKYYHFLETQYINNYSKIKHFINVKMPVIKSGVNVLHIIKDSPQSVLLDLKESNLTEVEIQKFVDGRLDNWKEMLGMNNFINDYIPDKVKEAFPLVRDILKNILNLCKNHNLKPVMVTTPFTRKLNGYFSDEFINEVFTRNLMRVNAHNVLYLDYRKDERFQDRYNLFVNGADWLSKSGREFFTQVVIEDIKRNSILEDSNEKHRL